MAETKTTKKASKVFTAEEREAMKDRAREQRAARGGHVDEEGALLAKLAEMTPKDRAMGEKLHAIIKSTVPALSPKLWYGMPAYALDGKLICFYQPAQKFKTRYATLGFSDKANLDEDGMWPNSYALMEMNADVEAKIRALVNKAVS